MITEKGKEPASPTSPVPQMAGLSISRSPPPRERPSAPPRPPATSKPSSPLPPARQSAQDDSDEDDFEDEDENDPFADRNAVTPRVERGESRW